MNKDILDFIPEIEAMRNGVEFRFPVNLGKYSVLLRPLSNIEQTRVTSECIAKLNQLQEHEKHVDQETNLLAKETLHLASTSDVGVYDPKLTYLILDRMTLDQLRYFYKSYIAICEKVNPNLETISEDRLKELVETVKKNPSFQLTELSIVEIINLCRYLILKDSRQDN